MAVSYEWDIESVDEHGDIEDHNHGDTLAGYPAYDVADLRQHRLYPDSNGLTYRLVLVRDVHDDIESLVDRQWCYDIGELGAEFSDGAKVPKRFHQELKKFNKT